MPKMNGMGPRGEGPLSGRGMGRCSNQGKTPCCGRRSFLFQDLSVEERLSLLEEEERAVLLSLEQIKTKKEELKEKK